MKRQPDMLITQDAQIFQLLQSFISGAAKKDGVHITLFSINQVNLNLDSRRTNSPTQSLALPDTSGTRSSSNLAREDLVAALEESDWNRAIAAKILNRNYSSVCERIRTWKISPPNGGPWKKLIKSSNE